MRRQEATLHVYNNRSVTDVVQRMGCDVYTAGNRFSSPCHVLTFFHPVLILYTIKTANTFKKLLVGGVVYYVFSVAAISRLSHTQK